MGEVRYDNGSELYCPYISGYHVNVPLVTKFTSVSRGIRTACTLSDAVIYGHGADADIHTHDDQNLHMFAMKLDCDYVHSVASDLLGFPVTRPIEMRSGIQLSRGPGREWWSLVRATFNTYRNDTAAARLMRESLSYAVAVGILSVTNNTVSDTLRAPVPQCAPQSVHRAAEFINSFIVDSNHNAAQALTPADVARHVAVSVRVLQRGFREHLAETPVEYIRKVRMKRVHEELRAAHPEATTVASIANKWGFYHGGRFAREYRSLYNCAPSETLSARGSTR
jgi:AraC-like DNA-binding protein